MGIHPIHTHPATITGFGSYSEYGKLREVVLGSAEQLTLPPFSADLTHYNPELRAVLAATGNQPLCVATHFPKRWARTCKQIEGIAAIFEANGVRVHRLRGYAEPEKRYLDFVQPGHSQLYPADPVFVIGKHCLEINIRRAYRRKEVFPIREVVLPMVDNDPEARYVAMPAAQPWSRSESGQGPGPFLEGGDLLIVGKDLLVGLGNLCSNRAGFEWLTRYLGPHGYTTHPLPLADDILHALGVICLLREGLAMAYLPALAEGLPPIIADWEVIELTREEMHGHASVGVSLDPKRYLMDARHGRVMDELDRRGIEPIPVPCDEIGYWGGAIRCLILPVRRDAA